jgi:predicted N-formylglutamate amidohydrolase
MDGDYSTGGRGHEALLDAVLDRADPPAVGIINPQGRSPFLLIGDHAGNRIPLRLGMLGLAEADRTRHIAWDIGVGALGEALAARLDAVFVRQTYSRLVVDCNRDPDAADAIPEVSDGTPISGNAGLSVAARAARIAAIHAPYQRAIAAEIARRADAGLATILVSLHSFTPALAGQDARPWDIGVLHDGRNDGFARRLLAALMRTPALVVGDNEPYRMDAIDHTVPRHAFPALPYVELEVAQRRLGTTEAVAWWCEMLAPLLDAAAG